MVITPPLGSYSGTRSRRLAPYLAMPLLGCRDLSWRHYRLFRVVLIELVEHALNPARSGHNWADSRGYPGQGIPYSVHRIRIPGVWQAEAFRAAFYAFASSMPLSYGTA